MTTATIHDNPTDAARAVVARLGGNFHRQGKRSCRECLRSKALPCHQVIELVRADETGSSSVIPPLWLTSLAVLEHAHSILLNEYTRFPPPPEEEEDRGGSGPASSPTPAATVSSSLACMGRIAASLRFVQLLLILPERAQQQPPRTSSTVAPSTPPFAEQQHVLPAEQVHKMVRGLLQGLCRGICDFVREWKNHPVVGGDEEDDRQSVTTYDPLEADATTGLDSRPVFCFAFASMLRMNHFVKTRGELLAPLWKGICDLAEVLLLVSERDVWRESLPRHFLIDAMKALGVFLQEGKERLEASAVTHVQSGQPRVDHALAFQGKLVGFMATRMTQLMRTYFVFYNHHQARDREHEMQARNAIFEIWRTLLGLRGMATALQLLCSTEGAKFNRDTCVDGSTLRVYFEVAAKTGKCIMSSLKDQDQSLLVSAVETLLHTDLDEVSPSTHRRRGQSAAQRFKEMGSVSGKVSILQQILSVDPSTDENQIEARVKVMDDLLLTSIPLCFEACATSYAVQCDDEATSQVTIPTTIIQRSLQEMARALKNMSPIQPQLHRLFLRWLAGADCRSKNLQHPLARELVVCLLHIHLVECAASLDTGQNITRLLSYLVKLLFDARTAPVLRSNVAVLLIRLQSTQQLQESSRTMVEREFASWIEIVSRRVKKRKRSCQNDRVIVKDPADFATISWALRGHGMSNQFATEPIPGRVCKTIRRLSGACNKESTVEQRKRLLASAEVYGLLLAWLERWLSSSEGLKDCIDRFPQVCGLNLFDFMRATLSAISNVSVEEGTCHSSSSRKKAILMNAAMRLSTTFGLVVAKIDDVNYPIESASRMFLRPLQTWLEGNLVASPRYYQAVALEAMSLLGSLGRLIPTECPASVLEVSESKSKRQTMEPKAWTLPSHFIQFLLHSCRGYVKRLYDSYPARIGLSYLWLYRFWYHSAPPSTLPTSKFSPFACPKRS